MNKKHFPWALPFPDAHRNRGMSLIEIIIVIALMGTLMTIVITNLTGRQDEAMIDAAKISMKSLSEPLQMYYTNLHSYPSTEEGLEALVTNPSNSSMWRGPYTESEKLKDPWGQPYTYQIEMRKYRITSSGKDRELGNSDDLTWPEEETKTEDAPVTATFHVPTGGNTEVKD